ncbi:MAG: PspC domain-containing protein [Bacteroidales bacterium]|nr:PspC domain-containing protein [Bacteroidales bacterium]
MKKVVSVHLGNKIFQMDEDAYRHLLQVLTNQWKMDELEAQIAERLEQKGDKTVVGLADVLEILCQMGVSVAGQPPPPPVKQLRRQYSGKLIAGVCTGLGEYLDMDTVIVRILFILAFFLGTVGFWIYLALWLIMPEAPRTAQL